MRYCTTLQPEMVSKILKQEKILVFDFVSSHFIPLSNFILIFQQNESPIFVLKWTERFLVRFFLVLELCDGQRVSSEVKLIEGPERFWLCSES